MVVELLVVSDVVVLLVLLEVFDEVVVVWGPVDEVVDV